MLGAFANIIVDEPSFVTGLDGFWAAASLDDLKLWARVHVIIDNASMLSSVFDKTNFSFYGQVLSGTKQQRDRWKRGVSLVNGICGEDVGKVYVKLHFPESSKKRMQELVSNLIQAYHISIVNSDWLGEETKRKAIDKLNSFEPYIGYPDDWRDYTALDVHADAPLMDNMRAAAVYEFGYQVSKSGKPVNKGEWLMNPQTVNAYYEPPVISSCSQPPFCNPRSSIRRPRTP